jgi:hypothetical protein
MAPHPIFKHDNWPIEMQEITRRLTTELRPKVDAVRATEAWTREGKRARRQLKQFLAELRQLAQASGQQRVIDAVGKIRLFILGNVMRPEELPNWDGAGGLN